jgi:hypothetical protein
MKIFFSAFAAAFLSGIFAASAGQVVGFDAQELSLGNISSSQLQKSFKNPDNLSRFGFAFNSKSEIRFEAVAAGNAGQALRLHLPHDGEESKSVYISFRDPQFAEYLNPAAPLVFEFKIQTPSDRNSLLGEVLFFRDGKIHAVCLFRSPRDKKSQGEPTFDLPTGEPLNVKITLSSQGGGVSAAFQAKGASGFSEEKEWTLRGTENFTLADIQFLNLLATPEQDAPATYLDIFAIKISQ